MHMQYYLDFPQSKAFIPLSASQYSYINLSIFGLIFKSVVGYLRRRPKEYDAFFVYKQKVDG